MDERRARIHEDLQGTLEGELFFEPLQRSGYSVDGSLYEIDPLGVIAPRSELDVVNAVRYAAENKIPITARGAGTGRAGGALGAGLIVDFSKAFRRVIAIEPDRVVVQPGVILDDLNARLAPLGRRIGPDPTGSNVRTLGGMVAVDAAGPSSLRYGTTGDHSSSFASYSPRAKRRTSAARLGPRSTTNRGILPKSSSASSAPWFGETLTSSCGRPRDRLETAPATRLRRPLPEAESTCRD